MKTRPILDRMPDLASTNSGTHASTLDPFTASGPPWHYKAYGLAIRSEIPLPEFQSSAPFEAPDVAVSLEPVHSGVHATSTSSLRVARDEVVLNVPDIGAFTVRNGSEIRARAREDADPTVLRLYVEGMLIAALLYQRGKHVLHASVVKIGDSAVAFLGHCGAGKSSTAAALHARGHAVVADDNAALDCRGGQVYVQPAFPYLKMFPAISEALGYDSASLRPLHQLAAKQGQSVTQCFPTAPVPLSRIYVLTAGFDGGFERLSSMQAMMEVIRNSVPTRWSHAADAVHLRQCAELANALPLYRVRSFDSLADLPRLAEDLEQHCGCDALTATV